MKGCLQGWITGEQSIFVNRCERVFVNPTDMRTDFSNNPLVRHCLDFSLNIIAYTERLEQQHKLIVAKQLLRCGTAIGALVMEAQSTESRADFVHKLKIADKEAFETWYWLYLCTDANSYPAHDMLMVSYRKSCACCMPSFASARHPDIHLF